RNAVRQQPEITASAGGPVVTCQANRCDRHLDQTGADLVRETRRIGHSVVIVANRVEARAIAIARVNHRVERPAVAIANRKAWRAIAAHFTSRDVFEHGLCKTDVGQKSWLGLLGGALVRESVTCDFMAAIGDPSNELRITLGDPAQREKRRVRVRVGKKLQYAVDVALDT